RVEGLANVGQRLGQKLQPLVTWGEGYHNFHHAFQADYRNGVRWWQYDPSKWLINLFAWTGLVYDRRWTPRFKILRARLHTEFRRLLNADQAGPAHDSWRATVEREYQRFRDTVNQWQEVQARKMRAGREAMNDRWVRTELPTQFKELEYRLKVQRRRLRALSASRRATTA
ncbi:MAG: acyl-CoA desaturase, partial [Thioalkalivibrio sp.]